MQTKMNRQIKKTLKADFALLCVAAIWGSSYSILKIGLGELPMFTLLAARFLLAAVILSIVFYKRVLKIDKASLKAGVLIGLFLFLGFAFFAAGLRFTEASRSGFIVGLLVVFVPLITAFRERRLPSKNVAIGVVLATAGLALLSLQSLSFRAGDTLILISAFFYAVHIVAVGAYAKEMDGPLLVIIQLLFGGIFFTFLSAFFDPLPVHISFLGVISVVYLACFASAIALLIQTAAQRHTSPDHAAIIFTFEPVFGAAFAWLFLKEVMKGRALLGAALILAGMLWVEAAGRSSMEKTAEQSGDE